MVFELPKVINLCRRNCIVQKISNGYNNQVEVKVMAETKTRVVADCRKFPSEKNCSLTITGTEEEVLTIATRHAVEEHGHNHSQELKNQIRSMLNPE